MVCANRLAQPQSMRPQCPSMFTAFHVWRSRVMDASALRHAPQSFSQPFTSELITPMSPQSWWSSSASLSWTQRQYGSRYFILSVFGNWQIGEWQSTYVHLIEFRDLSDSLDIHAAHPNENGSAIKVKSDSIQAGKPQALRRLMGREWDAPDFVQIRMDLMRVKQQLQEFSLRAKRLPAHRFSVSNQSLGRDGCGLRRIWLHCGAK